MDFRGAGQPFGGGHQAKACPVIAIQAAFRSGPDVTGAVLRQGEDDQVLQTVGCQVVAEAVLLGDTDAAPRQNQGSARTEPMPTIHHRFPRTPYRLKCEEYHGNRAGNSLALDPKRPKGSVAPRCTAVPLAPRNCSIMNRILRPQFGRTQLCSCGKPRPAQWTPRWGSERSPERQSMRNNAVGRR